MPELSVDEAQRLARLFLTGQAGEPEIQRLQSALADDQGAALELLAQMQAALDDSAPAGLNAEQDRSVNARIEALITPRIKKRGPFAFLLKLFKSKPKAEEEAPSKSRRRRRGAGSDSAPEAEPAPAVAIAVAPSPPPLEPIIGDSLGETLPGGGMEEMAPISAPSADATVGAGSSRPAPVDANATTGDTTAPANKRRLGAVVAALLVLVLLGYAANYFLHRPRAPKPAPMTAAVATPQPTIAPTPAGRTHRGVAIGPPSNEALPAEIPATTPVPAGSWPQ